MSTTQIPKGLYPFDPELAKVGDRVCCGSRTLGTIAEVRYDGPRVVWDHWSDKEKKLDRWPSGEGDRVSRFWKEISGFYACDPQNTSLSYAMSKALLHYNDAYLNRYLENVS